MRRSNVTRESDRTKGRQILRAGRTERFPPRKTRGRHSVDGSIASMDTTGPCHRPSVTVRAAAHQHPTPVAPNFSSLMNASDRVLLHSVCSGPDDGDLSRQIHFLIAWLRLARTKRLVVISREGRRCHSGFNFFDSTT
jgi:hypothetical protein